MSDFFSSLACVATVFLGEDLWEDLWSPPPGPAMMAAARIKAAHSNHFRHVYVLFTLIYIASETCNINVNRYTIKGMKIDYVRVNLFEVYGTPMVRHVVCRVYSSSVRYCNG
jgi:hypothetical protein